MNQVARVTRRFHPKGTDRVLRLLYNPDRRSGDHFETVRPYDGGLRILCDSASFLEWQIFFYGRYEPEITRLIRALCPPGGTAVDVGANVGCHTLVMASAVGPAGRVVAVEPHPRMFERLLGNLELNGLTGVDAVNCALGDEPGEVLLHAPPALHAMPAKATLHSANLLTSGFAEDETEAFAVSVRTLDDVADDLGLTSLNLIKIDVEGHEAPVLRGAMGIIDRYRPHVIFEYTREYWVNIGLTFADAWTFFDSLDYELREIRGRRTAPLRNLQPRNGNILALPRSQVAPGPDVPVAR